METIQILCATDNKYASCYGIMLTSLFTTNPDCRFVVHVLMGEEPSQDVRGMYERLAFSYGSEIRFIEVDESMLSNCPIRLGDHVTLATYFRLISPVLLPEGIDKILYLDGDIIVNGSIKDLWEMDISDVAVGGVTDESYFNPEIYERLGIDTVPYVNAGVLLINLRYWREHKVMERCLDCIDRMRDRLMFHDQDTINVVLQKEKKILPAMFNLQTGYLRPWIFANYSEALRREILEFIPVPRLIHFSGPAKPWLKFNDHPFRSYYLYFKRRSLWKDLPQVASTGSLARHIAGKALRFLHLKPKLYIIPGRKRPNRE